MILMPTNEENEEEKLKVEISKIEPTIQSEGYWIGERVVEVKMGDGKEYTIPNLAIESSKELNNMGIYSILFTSEDEHMDWDIILEYMEYMHEHYKISINTSGEEPIPKEFLQKERTFITLKPSFNNSFDFSTFENNVLKVTREEYFNFQISYEIENYEHIEKSLDMLAQMVTPRNLTVVYHPPSQEKKEKHLDILRKIRNYCSEKQMPPAYDIRVLPKIDNII